MVDEHYLSPRTQADEDQNLSEQKDAELAKDDTSADDEPNEVETPAPATDNE